MKKCKILLVLVVLMGVFAFNKDAYATRKVVVNSNNSIATIRDNLIAKNYTKKISDGEICVGIELCCASIILSMIVVIADSRENKKEKEIKAI